MRSFNKITKGLNKMITKLDQLSSDNRAGIEQHEESIKLHREAQAELAVEADHAAAVAMKLRDLITI